jgi:deoxyribodipyrimidine photo-lyase
LRADDERVSQLSPGDPAGPGPVIYWMQRAQRAECNHALDLAVRTANSRDVSVFAYFGLTDGFPGANLRHYRFMLEGIAETSKNLADRGVRLLVRSEAPWEGIVRLAGELGACAVVTDVGYLPLHRRWRRRAASALDVPLIGVETDCVVPASAASDHEEYAARTIRPKINRLLDAFLEEPEEALPRRESVGAGPESESTADIDALLEGLDIDRSVPPSRLWRGGRSHAAALLEEFLRHRIGSYHETARDPAADTTSKLSPYLHFGQISPLEVALRASELEGPGPEAFMEQLVVRRGLAQNMTLHNGSFRRIGCLPDWALATLREHAGDRREHLYGLQQLEGAETEDPYWNAAQTEMTATGRMHNYMRMYWGKKILEWSPSPQEALDRILALNDRWELDGRDPNGYAGALWCLGKHDRAWKERPVVGKVRWMSPAGLERKFDMTGYLAKVEGLAEGKGQSGNGG